MADGNSLINLGELAEPAKVLIEKISDAIGWVAKPYQIKRIANAEAEAEKIKALAQLEVSEIQNRGLIRMIQVEGKKQENIEQITYKAIQDLAEDAKPNDIDNDWLANFFDKGSKISDAEMQSLWSKVLSGEANKPGTYSKRTVNSISALDKDEANLFTTLCGFCWNFSGLTPLIYNFTDAVYLEHGINFGVLNHLESIGLITFNDLAGYVKQGLPQQFSVSYFGSRINVSMPEKINQIKVGKVLLTQIGKELAPICGAKPIEGFIDYTKQNWKNQKIII